MLLRKAVVVLYAFIIWAFREVPQWSEERSPTTPIRWALHVFSPTYTNWFVRWARSRHVGLHMCSAEPARTAGTAHV